jgi:FKBP-type peptidyl-prolyl cis-trans isomerase FkpA
MRVTSILSCLILAAFVACGDETPGDEEREIYDTEPPPAEVGPDTAAAASFAPELDVDLGTFERSSTGLYVKDLAAGDGPAVAAGQTAVVHYTGWLADGTRFQSSLDGNEPFAFPIGAGQVIPAWEEGIAGMKVGGRRKLVVPPDLAYGAQGAGALIPPNATIVFEVDLLEIR